ncbi:MAG: 3-phosphoshikimate 1-carboxyvinyltransferase [Flavobacteriaceae bacterium]|nr:3-phosphoshikimate 1-carboxyvinyltransferase [Flavobacteriaceae bacterium]|tara:strand:+ start:81243 stop:82430 length:1188 start_codon:yes stop_codon:yes gene_type:complete
MVQVTGSKSESNRLLILQALYPNLTIHNISESDDSVYLKKALHSSEKTIDIHHAGTAMRFLTAYFASQGNREVVLTGSSRMQERPIGILVEALQQMGAQISFEKMEGFPPLRITGNILTENTISIAGNTSSQYITALMLIAPKLPNGLTIYLEGALTSVPYIEMTLSLLKQIGVKASFREKTIVVEPQERIADTTVTVESDWSSASYFYSLVALSEGLKVTLKNYRKESFQGDAALVKIYEPLGVTTQFLEAENAMVLSKSNHSLENRVSFNLVDTPDIAQTIAVTCFGLGMECHLTGLHTLKIKETDRLEALKTELQKLGAKIEVDDQSLHLSPTKNILNNVDIDTYNDHRMAMAFAPLALKTSLAIKDCRVVTKSFPTFWEDLKNIGISVSLQ